MQRLQQSGKERTSECHDSAAALNLRSHIRDRYKCVIARSVRKHRKRTRIRKKVAGRMNITGYEALYHPVSGELMCSQQSHVTRGKNRTDRSVIIPMQQRRKLTRDTIKNQPDMRFGKTKATNES